MDVRSVPAGQRWAITEKGSHDLRCLPECDCRVRLSGLLIECANCGTVYGHLREQGPYSFPRPKRD